MVSAHIQQALDGLQRSLGDCKGISEGRLHGPLAIRAVKKSVHDLRSLRHSFHLEREGLCDWLDEAGVRLWNDSVILSANDSCGSPLEPWLKWMAFCFIDAGTPVAVDSSHTGQLVTVGSLAAQALIDSDEMTLGQEVLERVAEIASDHQEEPPSMALYWCARVALALAQQADDLAHYLISKALDAQCDRKTLAWLVVRRVKRVLEQSPPKTDAALNWLRESWLTEVCEADEETQLARRKLEHQASPGGLPHPQVIEAPPLATQHTKLLDRSRALTRRGWSSLCQSERDQLVADLEVVVSTSTEEQLTLLLGEVCRLKDSKTVVGLLVGHLLDSERKRSSAVIPALLWFLSKSDVNDVSLISKMLRKFEVHGYQFDATEATLAHAILWRQAEASISMGSSRIADAQELLTLGCLGNAFAASAEESSKAFRKKVALLHITNSDLLAARNACFDVLDDAPSAYLVFMSASLAGQVSEASVSLQRLVLCHNFKSGMLLSALSHIKGLADSELQTLLVLILCESSMARARQQRDSTTLAYRCVASSLFQLGRLAEVTIEAHRRSLIIETMCKILELDVSKLPLSDQEARLEYVGPVASVVCKALLSVSLTQAESLLASLDQFLRCHPTNSSSFLADQLKASRAFQFIHVDTVEDERRPLELLSLIKAGSKGYCCTELEDGVVLCLQLLVTQKEWKAIQTSLQAYAGDIFSDSFLRHVSSLLMLQSHVAAKQQILFGRVLLQLFMNTGDIDADRLWRWFHFLIQLSLVDGQREVALYLAQDLSKASGNVGLEFPADELQWLLSLSWEFATATYDCAGDNASDGWMIVCNRLQDCLCSIER